jgi:Breast carcinoma amplified sequence 2 (BCAS2)
MPPTSQESSGSSVLIRGTATGDDDSAIVLDSLPYFDGEQPDYLNYARTLIDQEVKQPQPNCPSGVASQKRQKLSDYATGALKPVFFRTPAVREAFERVSSSTHSTSSSTVIRTLDPPSDSCKDVTEWVQAVRRARIAFESERIRAAQLAVDKGDTVSNATARADSVELSSSAEVWKRYNSSLLEPTAASLAHQLDQQRQAVEAINFMRQEHQQQQVGPRLQRQMAVYHELVQKQGQLKSAIATLRLELESQESSARN